MPAPPPVAILGRGRLGVSLARALEAAAVGVSLASSRDDAAVAAATAPADLVVLAVPDGAITASADRVLAAAGAHRPAVVHLSGALGEAPLARLAAAGFLPFPEPRPPSAFAGGTIGVHGSTPALEARLSEVARRLGAVPRPVAEAGRVLYHAAAVMASGFVVALAAQAAGLLEGLGWEREEALAALVPLLAGSVDALAEHGLPDGLSGPLRRGDADTVARHLDALRETAPLTLETYVVLSRTALALAVEAGLDPAVAAEVEARLG
jgi:predicted short-subunit dehydrogenase-like oxidoreductase (DUF2520 family)